jgi:hypothetical protein
MPRSYLCRQFNCMLDSADAERDEIEEFAETLDHFEVARDLFAVFPLKGSD